MQRSIWLLDHGASGHFAQVAGVADMLARAGIDLPQKIIPVSVSIPGWARAPLRSIGAHAPRAVVEPLLAACHSMPALPDTPPALILGSSGTSAWTLRLLGWKTGAPTAFVGSWQPFPRDWFTYGLSPHGEGPQEVATDFLVSRMTPERVTAAAAERFGSPKPGTWALLVGARSRSHPFDAEDWATLADSVNARARESGVRWLISTSPRTGAEAEAILAERIDPGAIDALVLWGRSPDKCAAAFMGAADRVFVTRDSLTMLAEAIASGKPATAIAPRDPRLEEGYYLRMLARMREAGWLEEVTCAGLATGAVPGGQADPARFAARESAIVALLAPCFAS